MFWKIRGVALCLTAAMVVAACSSGGSDDEVRNITLPPTTTFSGLQPEEQPLEVRSLGDGRAAVGRAPAEGPIPNLVADIVKSELSAAELDAAMRRALRGLVFTPSPDPIPDIRWQQLDEITAIAGAAPVIARLPVAFDAYQTGKALQANVKTDATVWGKATFARGSNDPAIAKATLTLHTALTRQRAFSQRSTDLGLMYSAVAGVVDGIGKPAASGVLVRGVNAFAQLGAVPFVRLLVTRDEAQQLYQQGLIAGFAFDSVQPFDLDETTDLIQSDRFQAPVATTQWSPALVAGVNGSGATIAVLDSGVSQTHPALRGAFGDGACYLDCDGAATALDAVETLTAASPCPLNLDAGCDHGTHVAGIVAGRAVTLPDGTRVPAGVAPGARVAAYRVCATEDTVNPSGCIASAAIQALGRVATRATSDNIVAANMSFGWPNRYDECPTDTSTWNNPAAATAAGVAFAAGVQLVKSNGNGGRFRWAECESTMIVVANSTKLDTPSPTTDFHPDRTTLFAPGTFILAASVDDRGAANAEVKSGTSMAAPHMAGAMALLDQAVREYNRRVPEADRTALARVWEGWLGLQASDPARIMITDSRSGTDTMSNTSSGGSVPRLSLHNVWQFLTGQARSQITSTPRFTAPVNQVLRDQTPAEWTITREAARRDFGADAVPVRVLLGASSTSQLAGLVVAGALTPFAGRPFLDGPYLVAYTRNGEVRNAVTATNGTPLTIQRLARGPQPCMAAGWVESARVPLTEAAITEGVNVETRGVDTMTVWQVEGVVSSSRSVTGRTVSVDYRPIAFGGSTTFPRPVNLGAHRPALTTESVHITWFDLDRVTGDVTMLDDASQAGRFTALRRTRTVNDAVAQSFNSFQQTRLASPELWPGTGVIGWQEVEGVHDCAVAMNHVWMGK